MAHEYFAKFEGGPKDGTEIKVDDDSLVGGIPQTLDMGGVTYTFISNTTLEDGRKRLLFQYPAP